MKKNLGFSNNHICMTMSKGIDSKEVKLTRKEINADELYRHSSQYRYWSFSPQSLTKKREETNKSVFQAVQVELNKYIESNRDKLTDLEVSTIRSKAVPLTPEEELQIVNFYAKKVQVIAQHLNLPTEVIATSITFFKRFFLVNSVMNIDPKELVHTTIFLACKSENYFISVDTFATKAKSTRENILKYEFTLLESLNFSLLNHHPYKPLHGFFLDIQSTLFGKVDLKYMGQIYDRSRKRITDTLLTDVIYYYTPPQITLAVLLIEDEHLIRRYLEIKFAPPQENTAGSDNSNENDQPGKETNAKSNNSSISKMNIIANTGSTTDINNRTNSNESVKKEPVVSKDENNEPKTETSTYKDEKKKEEEEEEEEVTPGKIKLDKLMKTIEDCKNIIENFQNINTQDAKTIYAKLYYCKHPNILIQKLKRKQEQAHATEDPESKKQKVEG